MTTTADQHAMHESSCTSPVYTTDDWQAQLEEVLALHSIYAENFRVINIPGYTGNQHSHADTSDSSSLGGSGNGSSGNGSSSSRSSSGGCMYDHAEQLEQQLESLIGSDPPGPSAPAGLLTCEALVSVELPSEQLQLMLDMPQADQLQQQADSTATASTNGRSSHAATVPFGPPVRHLPPVRVQLQLPRAYPSSEASPPVVQLQASWLSSQHQLSLQQQLQELWQEQGPGPVCFSILEHIKAAALPALGITEELVLSAPTQQQGLPSSCSNTCNNSSSSSNGTVSRLQPASSAGTGSSNGIAGPEPASHMNGAAKAPTAAQLSPSAAPFVLHSRSGQHHQQHCIGHKPHEGQQEHRRHKQHKDADGAPQSQQLEQQHQQHQAQVLAAIDPHNGGQQQQEHLLQQRSHQRAAGAEGAGGCSVEQLALQLLRYSAAREQDDFNQSTWTCGICFDQVPGSSCLRLPACHHFYCAACLRSAAAAQLETGAVENMRCPEPSCRQTMPPFVVKELLGQEEFNRWEGLLLTRALDRMHDVVYCPRCDTVCVEDADHCAQCAKCLYVFCTFCSDSWHPGTECLDPHERLRVLERRRRGTTKDDHHRDMDLLQQAMNIKYIAGASKACPGCGMATMKTEGCNKMTCSACGLFWCWKCLQLIDGYDHFKEGGTCVMFDQAEIDRWHAMLFANERAQQVEAGQLAVAVGRNAVRHGARLCRCPVCGQENLREGRNNLLRCWSCNCHFCFACGSWLRGRVGQHFIGAGSCKQHGN